MSNKHCGPDVVKYFVVEPSTGGSTTGATGNFYVCSGTTFTDVIDPCSTGVTINSNFSVYQNATLPTSDGTKDLGSPVRRFRDINTISGTSTDRVITPNLDLGLDGLGNPRIITADNSVIQNDILNGGSY